MNAERSDFDRALRIWFEDGPTVMADRVVDVIADRIARQPQRRPWRLRWRPFMNTYVKLAAGLAAALIVAVVGYNLLPKQAGPGRATSAPSAVPTSAPTEAPQSSPIPIHEGRLTGGRYSFQPFTSVPSLTIVADVPADWGGVPSWAVVGPDPAGTEAPRGIGVAFLRADGLWSDPCHWDLDGTGKYDQPGDVEVGPTVDDLVEALRANTSYTSSTPSPMTFPEFEGSREFAGYELEIQLPADLEVATCDRESDATEGNYFVFSGVDAGLYAQGDGNRWHMFIVDVNGTRVIVVGPYYEGTPLALTEAAGAIFESIEIAP